MDYKYLVLLVCVAGASAQTIADFPSAPVGMSLGFRHEITCGISNRGGSDVSWTHNGDLVYNGQDIVDRTNYALETETINNIEYFNLVILSAKLELAGEYVCQCLPQSNNVAVLVFEEPSLSPVNSAQLVAGDEEVMSCEVLYGAQGVDEQFREAFELMIVDGDGLPVQDVNADRFEYIDQPDPTLDTYRRYLNTSSLTLDWEDDSQEYACVITMQDYSFNTTVSLNVLHAAGNISLSPYDPLNEYYKTEQVYAEYSANPAAKQWIWSRYVDGDWQMIEDDDDMDDHITIGNWPRETTIKVDIINSFDHDDDGIQTDQNATEIFALTIYDCCRTGDASHVTYSALMTSLVVFISAFVMGR